MIAWTAGDLVKLGPDLSKFKNAYQKGRLAIVQDKRPTERERRDARMIHILFERQTLKRVA